MRYFLILLLPIFLFSNSGLLKDSKQTLLENQRKEAELKGDLYKNLWWGGLQLEASYNWTDTPNQKKPTERVSDDFLNMKATISQDIFRSGGIYWQIRKGKVFKSLNKMILDKQEKNLIFTLYSLVLQIKKLDIGIQKQQLSIKNQNILITNQKDKYINGMIDISILDESIIQLNSLKNGEEGIVQQRIDLIANLKDITNLDYKQIKVPKFSMISIDRFLNKNIELNIQNQLIEQSRIEKNLAYSKFLPKVSVYGSHQYENSLMFPEERNSFRYGVKLTIPIGFNFSDAIETAKVVYLRTQSELIDKKDTQKNIYSKIISKLESIKRRVKNSKELIQSYQSIYEITNEYYKSDLKTKDDVTILKNRVDISKFDLDIYAIDKELTTLILYQLIL